MAKVSSRIKAKITEHIARHRKAKNNLSSNILLVIIALTAALGYVAGTYHYQIEAAIGPVFGYNAHSGSLDLS